MVSCNNLSLGEKKKSICHKKDGIKINVVIKTDKFDGENWSRESVTQ